MTIRLLIALFTSATALADEAKPVVWQKDSDRAKELTEVNSKLTQAYQEEDLPVLRDMLSDAHVHNNVFGSSMGKDQFLKDLEDGTLVFETYTTPELQWYIKGDVAIATGLIEAKAVRAGKPVPASTFRFTRVFSRENGKWKVLLFQNTMTR